MQKAPIQRKCGFHLTGDSILCFFDYLRRERGAQQEARNHKFRLDAPDLGHDDASESRFIGAQRAAINAAL
jgi:hypothetical protein